jgi:glycosyltransferase involved in cell wall biosynthesis
MGRGADVHEITMAASAGTAAAMPADPAGRPPRLLLVVPTYDERENLPALVERVFAALPGAEVLVVDDGSPDGTADLVRELAAGRPGLHLLERRGERGLGRAYVAGLARGLAAGYEVLGTMDADLSHDPAYLPAMLARMADGKDSAADVVIGSRYVPGGGTVHWGLHRRLLSRLANRFAARLLGLRLRDLTSGFRLYRAQALAAIDLAAITSTGYSFLAELLYRLDAAGARIAESPIVFVDRREGRSKLSPAEIPKGAYHLLRLRLGRTAPARSAAPAAAK